jgi:hypothetical protein
MHVTATHIPGVQNVAADHLSRLEKSGDYEITQYVLDKGLKQLRTAIDIDLFTNEKNRKCPRCASISKSEGVRD